MIALLRSELEVERIADERRPFEHFLQHAREPLFQHGLPDDVGLQIQIVQLVRREARFERRIAQARPLLARRADEDVDDGLAARACATPSRADRCGRSPHRSARARSGRAGRVAVRVPERALFGAEHARRLPPVPLPEQRPGHILDERIREHTHSDSNSLARSNGPVSASSAASACRTGQTSP